MDIDKDEVFDFLDDLREGGTINMFGAPAVLRQQFGFTKNESFAIWSEWSEKIDKSFDDANKEDNKENNT